MAFTGVRHRLLIIIIDKEAKEKHKCQTEEETHDREKDRPGDRGQQGNRF